MSDACASPEDGPIDKREPKSSRGWLAAIDAAEEAFRSYQEKSDSIDKEYADLNRLAAVSRDRQFQLFWANIQVIGPSIYSRPPIPVVIPRFKDRRPVPRMAAELLERSATVAFEMGNLDSVMLALRDDLTVLARGVPWLRYETKADSDTETERVCLEHVDRKDFLHEPARTWPEVGWVAKRSWLTKQGIKDRFGDNKELEIDKLAYIVIKDDKENGAADKTPKVGVWEIWSKTENHVYWVTEGFDEFLDDDKPHLSLQEFFPCPRPAYGTTQRRSLVPVPDMVFYKDQLEEINELTARISALAESIKVRGFYPAGAGDIGDAIEAAIKATTDNQVMVPVSNWAAFGGAGTKDTIVWLPIDMIVEVVTQLVDLRKQLIDDVYQITGISDIMRGETEASETLGAQQLKSQYGSVRIRDRQNELVRVARDITRITCEIMAENFAPKTLLDMSQMDIATDAEVKREKDGLDRQIKAIIANVERAKADPAIQQQAQENPEQAQQMLQQAQQQADGLQAQLEKLDEKPTIEKIMKMLRDQRVRPFVLDIETDSTIAPDENAQKQRATEFITAVGGFMGQSIPLVEQVPQAAPLAAEMLKYVASQFRAGRQLESVIDEFADTMAQAAKQPRQDPLAAKGAAEAQAVQQATQIEAGRFQMEQQKAVLEQQRQDAEAQENRQREDVRLQADLANKDADERRKVNEADIKLSQMAADDQRKAQEHDQKLELGALAIRKLMLEIEGVQVKTAATQATTAAKIEQTETQTDNSIRSTDASVQATADSTAIKADAAKSKEEA